MEIRAKSSEAHLEAVIRSLIELLEYAARYGIHLGLENRYHYLDIPSQDEMALLLEQADPDRLGFIYAVGHAQVMDNLGFYSHRMWLERFAERISGVHLHEVRGLQDHYAPGLGEVDFQTVASHLPREAFRTCELQGYNSTEQIKESLQVLVDTGCIYLK